MVDIVHCAKCSPILADCAKCSSNQGNPGFWDKGVGGVRGKWESGSKVPQENFLFFETEIHLHIVNIDTH